MTMITKLAPLSVSENHGNHGNHDIQDSQDYHDYQKPPLREYGNLEKYILKIEAKERHRDTASILPRINPRPLDIKSIVFPWREGKLSRFMTGFILLKNVMKGLSYCK